MSLDRVVFNVLVEEKVMDVVGKSAKGRKAEPESFWQVWQWQCVTHIGSMLLVYRTPPQRQLPVNAGCVCARFFTLQCNNISWVNYNFWVAHQLVHPQVYL
jgi:hypothetical protein